jgi:transcriptional regulator with XRE-family HTH domain
MGTYGQYFKALREAKAMTLRDVEKIADISNAYLSQLESGKVRQPSPIILHKLAEIYGVSYDMLMEKVGYPAPHSQAISKANASVAHKVGDITKEEELELLNYLKFIRSRKK